MMLSYDPSADAICVDLDGKHLASYTHATLATAGTWISMGRETSSAWSCLV